MLGQHVPSGGQGTDKRMKKERMLRDSGPLAPSTYYNISMTFVKDKSKYCSFYEMAKRRSPALKPVRNPGSRDSGPPLLGILR